MVWRTDQLFSFNKPICVGVGGYNFDSPFGKIPRIRPCRINFNANHIPALFQRITGHWISIEGRELERTLLPERRVCRLSNNITIYFNQECDLKFKLTNFNFRYTLSRLTPIEWVDNIYFRFSTWATYCHDRTNKKSHSFPTHVRIAWSFQVSRTLSLRTTFDHQHYPLPNPTQPPFSTSSITHSRVTK